MQLSLPSSDMESWSAPTTKQLVQSFNDWAVTEYVRNGKPTGEATNCQHATSHLLAVCAQEPADRLQADHFRAAQQHMIRADLARTTIKARMGRIRRCIKWGVEHMKLPAVVLTEASLIKPPKHGRVREAPKVTSVAPSIVKQTIDWLLIEANETPNSRHQRLKMQMASIVQVAFLTGMRPGEVAAMELNEIDTSQPVWVYKPKWHKVVHHGLDRVIGIGPKAQDELLPWMGMAKADNRKCVWSEVNPQTFYQAIHRVCRRRQIPHWHPNQLRHTFVTRMSAKYGRQAASQLAGHADESTTQTYIDQMPSQWFNALLSDG